MKLATMPLLVSFAVFSVSCAAAVAPDLQEERGKPGMAPEGFCPSETPCGSNVCDVDEYCCNESCGICAPLGGSCTQEFCGPTEPGGFPCGDTFCGEGQYCCDPSCGACIRFGALCVRDICGPP